MSSENFSRPCSKNGCYDVFLSFRGEDTRYGFTSYLYRLLREKEVYTFMDVKLTGEDIDYLFEMIGKSHMAVVIYSENFASSDWCLRELELILQRRKEKKMMMIPIFYKVDVYELKHITGRTAEYLNNHIQKHGETTVQKWKDAITNFGKVSGLPYKDTHGRYEYDFIVEVIARIKEKLEEYDSFIQSPPQEVYHIVTSGYFQKLEEIMGELISIKPAKLNFIIEWRKKSSISLVFSNKTDNYVAYKVKSTHPTNYIVNPDMGLLSPRSTCEVIVTMKAQVMQLYAHMKCSDKFVVENVKAKNDSSSMVNISAMFTKESGNTIHKSTMGVVYVDPPQPVSPVPADNVSDGTVVQLSNKGLVQGLERVKSIDLHPTKPWVLLGLWSGIVCIWNYETRVEEKSFKVANLAVGYCATFVHEKHWIVVGAYNGIVRVYDYNTSEKLKEFEAYCNNDPIACVEVHPTLPYVVTTSYGKFIKLWNWKNDWACVETFEGHSHVMQVAFNPKDSSSFVSVSQNGTIKIWSFGSSEAKFTIDAHAKVSSCVEYFVVNDNKLYLLSGSDDYTAKIWDYDSRTLVQTLEGHLNSITTTLVHPDLPIIITGSVDKTIRIWNKNTHKLELVWKCDLGRVWSIKFIKTSNEFVLACDEGIVLIRIVDAGTQSD